MNFTESFQEFSSKLSTMDLALYAGLGLTLWVLFKDKLSPVQTLLNDLLNKMRNNVNTVTPPAISLPNPVPVNKVTNPLSSEDVFFKLVVSWKQTRDLAVKSGCDEAVKVADQMFPFLSPNVCNAKKDTV
jgi:hypothetical protein